MLIKSQINGIYKGKITFIAENKFQKIDGMCVVGRRLSLGCNFELNSQDFLVFNAYSFFRK